MCCSKGLLKRFVPFLATFAVGLFIASFFVSIAAPQFRFGRGHRHREYDRQMQFENQRLQEENLRLKQQNVLMEVQPDENFDGDIKEAVPPVPPMPPAPPAPVRRAR